MKPPQHRIISRWQPMPRRSSPVRPLGALPIAWAMLAGILIAWGIYGCQQRAKAKALPVPAMRGDVGPRVHTSERFSI